MENARISNLEIENARIFSKNFSGKQGQYNPEGNRNFCLAIDPSVAEKMKEDGWNIRYLKPRNPDDEPAPYLNVKVAFEPYPPKIWLMNSKGRVTLTEEDVNMLDWAEIDKVDVVVRPRIWDNKMGNHGVKGYLKAMYVTIREDAFESKYRDIPDSAQSATLGVSDDDDSPFEN